MPLTTFPGWNYTGDAYLVDDDGYFHFQARADDMIISSGYNISGIEVESALLKHPAVKDCGVVGSPDAKRGHLVKAYIVLRNPDDACDELVKELQDFVKGEIAPYKYPRAIAFWDDLPRGYFHFQARADDMIISSGYNISGIEVESALLKHPAVKDCGVVGSPDAKRGHLVKAYIVLRNPDDACDELVKELQDFVKGEIAPYKYPRAIAFWDDLPRTQTGKVQRFKLREDAVRET